MKKKVMIRKLIELDNKIREARWRRDNARRQAEIADRMVDRWESEVAEIKGEAIDRGFLPPTDKAPPDGELPF